MTDDQTTLIGGPADGLAAPRFGPGGLPIFCATVPTANARRMAVYTLCSDGKYHFSHLADRPIFVEGGK